MVDGLFFCTTLTGRRRGHTPSVQTEKETSDTSAEAVELGPRCCWEGHSDRVVSGVRDESAECWSALQPFRILSHSCYCCQMNSWVVVQGLQMGVSIWKALHLHSMDRWALSGAGVRNPCRARDNVVPLRRISACWMPARTGRLSAGLGFRHPVTIRKESLMAGLIRRAWALQYQAGAQYYYSGLKVPCHGWLFATLLLQHPSLSQQAASGVESVISAFCEVTQGIGGTSATCPRWLRDRSIWSPNRRAGFCCCGWLSAHV